MKRLLIRKAHDHAAGKRPSSDAQNILHSTTTVQFTRTAHHLVSPRLKSLHSAVAKFSRPLSPVLVFPFGDEGGRRTAFFSFFSLAIAYGPDRDRFTFFTHIVINPYPAIQFNAAAFYEPKGREQDSHR